jgi:Carboxypeptidase regulatory-like domain
MEGYYGAGSVGLYLSFQRRFGRLGPFVLWIGRTGEDKVKRRMAFRVKLQLVVLALSAVVMGSACFAQAREPWPLPSGDDGSPPASAQGWPGAVSGKVMDQSGAVVVGARVKITAHGQSQNEEALSDSDGQFSFSNVTPGPFQLTVTSSGFSPQTLSGVLHSGEIQMMPPVTLSVADAVTEVQVALTQTEVAEEQIKLQEKQRVLGVVPNFYVSYVPNAAPLDSKQKFELAWKTVIDPFTFAVVAGAAGIEQWQNHFSGYGQGAQGYAKRYGAGYADTLSGTFIGSAILPSLLKQDPRYFYKGTGSKPARFAYAVANSLVCKGDNGRWQPNYSNVLGNLAAGGISNLYYPPQDRNGIGLTFENGAIGIVSTAVANVIQEFIARRFTPKLPSHDHDSVQP